MEFLRLRVDGEDVGIWVKHDEPRNVLSNTAADGKGWYRQFYLGHFRGRACKAHLLDHTGGGSVFEVLGRVTGSVPEDDEFVFQPLHGPINPEEERARVAISRERIC